MKHEHKCITCGEKFLDSQQKSGGKKKIEMIGNFKGTRTEFLDKLANKIEELIKSHNENL